MVSFRWVTLTSAQYKSFAPATSHHIPLHLILDNSGFECSLFHMFACVCAFVYLCLYASNVIKNEIVWYCILIRQLNKVPCLVLKLMMPSSFYPSSSETFYLTLFFQMMILYQVDRIKHFNQTDWNKWWKKWNACITFYFDFLFSSSSFTHLPLTLSNWRRF